MTLTTIRPVTNVDTAWPDEVGGTRPGIVADSVDGNHVDNDDTSGDFIDRFEMGDLPGEAVAITSFEYFTRSRRGTGQNGDFEALINVGGGTESTVNHNATQGAGFQTISDVRTNDPDGNPWTVTNVNSVRAGAKQQSGTAAKDMAYTDLWIEVVHSVGGGRFVSNVGQWLAPLIGAASHALMRREIFAILRRLDSRPSSPEELAALEAAFRVRPIYGSTRWKS